MGYVLCYVPETYQKLKKIPFLDDESVLITNTVHRGKNMLVIRSKNIEGCRVLLTRSELLTLQDLERDIFETTSQKEMVVQPMVLRQFNQIWQITNEKAAKCEFTNIADVKMFVKLMMYEEDIMENQPKSTQCFTSQLKLLVCEPIASQWNDIISDKKVCCKHFGL